MSDELAFEVHLHKPYEEALTLVVEALNEQGFGVLTRIDVAATLQEKLGEVFRPYTILGACNPPLAHRALKADARVGVLLPCNVTVEESEGKVLVRLADPQAMLTTGSLGEQQEVRSVAEEARQRILLVAERLAAH